jgi:hypothetical protein
VTLPFCTEYTLKFPFDGETVPSVMDPPVEETQKPFEKNAAQLTALTPTKVPFGTKFPAESLMLLKVTVAVCPECRLAGPDAVVEVVPCRFTAPIPISVRVKMLLLTSAETTVTFATWV